mgnify:FL=1
MDVTHFLSITDLTPQKVTQVIGRAQNLKNGPCPKPLEGKTIALLFEKPSLRTRVSFEVGVRQLGGECVYLSKDDVGLGVREPVEDVARVLGRWVDGIVARVFEHSSLVTLAEYANIPVINALSDLEHPCQAIGDLLTIQEHRGQLDGQRVAFVGDGNNVAGSLAVACGSTGTNFILASPMDYQLPSELWEEAKSRGAANGSSISWVELPEYAARGADVIYTDVWISMGNESETKERMKAFSEYQVNEYLMQYAKSDAIFMHDMPAKEGLEISEGMIDHPRSVVFDQAENRLHAQKAIMVELFDMQEGDA